MTRARWTIAIVLAMLAAAPPVAAQEPAQEPETAAEEASRDSGVESEAGDEAEASGEEEPEAEVEIEAEEPKPELDLPGLPGAEERITFEIPFASGGTIKGSARDLEYLREDYVVARGGVEMTQADYRFQGDRVEVDLQTRIVTARGNVILDQGPGRITAETMVFDMNSETGQFTEAAAYINPDIYFNGETIDKTGEDIYVLRNGVVTSCSGDVPVWSFKSGKIRVNADGYTRVRNTTMRVKKLPILYLPYMLYPSSQDRKSGLLFPNLGYSDRRGYLFGLAYFQTLGDSYDATLFVDTYGKDFLGLGGEFRYRPTVGTAGILDAYTIDDSERETTRWKATLSHESSDLGRGLRAVIRAIQVSDFDYFQDFERDFSQISLRRLNSSAYLTGNWGQHSFNFVLDELQTLLAADRIQKQRQLPEVEYFLRPTQLFGVPIYLDVAASAHLFSAERPGTEKVSYGRADLAPSLTVPLSYWPWLSASVNAGARTTYYDDSLDPQQGELSGESVTRFFPFGDLSIIGPSFSRIFEKKIGPFGKFKHIVEPRVTYNFVGDPSNQERVPIFDSIDTAREASIITYALVNRLLAKPANEELAFGAREIMSFELSQAFSLNNDQPFQISRDRSRTSRHSRIGMLFRFSPSLRTNFEARATYATLFEGIDTASISGGTAIGRHQVGLTWFARVDTELDRTTSHQARLFSAFELVPTRVRYTLTANYDFALRILQQHRHRLEFFGQCFSLLFEYRQLTTATLDDQEIRLAISLKNIGTFLDINGGSREGTY